MKVEVQLRTISMDWWASLEHKIRYKKDVSDPAQIEKELFECAEMGAVLDERMERIHAAAIGSGEEKKTEKKRGLFRLPEREGKAMNKAEQ